MSAVVASSSAAAALLPDDVTRPRSVATIVEARPQREGEGMIDVLVFQVAAVMWNLIACLIVQA